MSETKTTHQEANSLKQNKAVLIIWAILVATLFIYILWAAYTRQLTGTYTVLVRNSFVFNSTAGAVGLAGSLVWAMNDKLRALSIILLRLAVVIFLVGILTQLVAIK